MDEEAEVFVCDVLQCSRAIMALLDVQRCAEDSDDVTSMFTRKARGRG